MEKKEPVISLRLAILLLASVLFCLMWVLILLPLFGSDLNIKEGKSMPGQFYHTTVEGTPCVIWKWKDKVSLSCDFINTTTTTTKGS